MPPRLAYSTLIALLLAVAQVRGETIDFNRDVRPILSDKCFQCHGPDAQTREADLRLDTEEGALADLGGYSAFRAADVENSEALRRVFSDDKDEQMPPPNSKLELSETEKEKLRLWVEQGAKWDRHWSFQPPVKPPFPKVSDTDWPINEIDYFVLARIEAAGLKPSPHASREKLIRRVTLDLTGLPPTLEEVDAFLADQSAGAYEKVVDRLLRSQSYGERMAWEWLDAARYADTDGFQGDPTRTMWPWRDWLIRALNDNMPFDQFTIEVLAGDLLPNASAEQVVATGFNRNHMYNGEGGRIAEETRVENVFDRAETTSTVWLGLTMTCARCHDHKFDPISQQEYYQLYAFFNNTSESGKGGRGKAPPVLEYQTPDQRAKLAALDARIAELKEHKPDAAGDSEKSRELAKLEKERAELKKASPAVMVMDELPTDRRRKAAILYKGIYDQPGKEVTEGTPAFLPPLTEDEPRNRLTLARWLVDPANPLTARVTVNRYWQTFFGKGLVETTEDFGRQGSLPTHPQLLDWLATRFIESGWDVKAMHKLIVMSATYRQSSAVGRISRSVQEEPSISDGPGDPSYSQDPDNRLLARAPRYRLPSWMLRDQALALGGLLVDRIGGPPVKPYQPAGVWAEATFGKIRYSPDSGQNLYRRSLYVFWRRIVGPTMFFDSGKRQTCEVKPTRTNTPLHALTTLNETTYVEAARAMAERLMKLPDRTSEERIAYGFRLGTSRVPTPDELDVLLVRLKKLESQFASQPDQAKELLSVGQSPRDQSLDAARHAAYTVVCSLLLNLDETLARE